MSIALSTLHTALALWMAWSMYQTQLTPTHLTKDACLWFGVSLAAVLAVGPFKALLGPQSVLYLASIQFFLHAQFNGWLFFVLLALLANLDPAVKAYTRQNRVRWQLHMG
ncbi:hypothetical protein RZS08_34105, partial [Arthrospira platensis SPKY1]|nr:hypothetical protein [Arthrospira platensis SPKY1]